MAEETSRFDPGTLAGKALGLIGGFFQRILVHTLALLCGLVVPAVAPAPGTGFLAAGLGVYTGVICLVGRNASLTPAWLFPSIAGGTQILIALALGNPPAVALFWGGAQAFLQRTTEQGGRIGGEWVTLLLLAPLGLVFSAKAAPVWLNPLALAVAGSVFWLLGRRFVRLPLTVPQLRKIRGSGLELEQLADSGDLPDPLAHEARRLAGLLREHSSGAALLPNESAMLLRTVETLADGAREFAASAASKAWDARAGALQAAMERLSEVMRAFFPADRSTSGQATGSGQTKDTPATTVYRASLDGLARKKHLLPPELQRRLDAIIVSGAGILECMIEDPRDVPAGKRFLDRYLQAAHTVADDHARLSRGGFSGDEAADALAMSADMLARLEAAFAKEYKVLLQNDVIDLSADLKVLDTLLKMDGR